MAGMVHWDQEEVQVPGYADFQVRVLDPQCDY